jgi:hypothetical protein
VQSISVSAQTLDTRFKMPKPFVPGYIESITETADRRIVVAGDFDYLNGKPYNAGLAKFSARGTVDGTFRTDFEGDAEKVVALEDGRLLVYDDDEEGVAVLSRTGKFLFWLDYWVEDFWVTSDGAVFLFADESLYKLTEDLEADESFGWYGEVWFDGYVNDVEYTNGQYYVAGDYDYFWGADSEYNVNDLVRLNAAGELDEEFDFGSGASGEDGVGSVAVLSDGTLLLGNAYYNSVNGINFDGRMPRVHPDGSVSHFNSGWWLDDIGDVIVVNGKVIFGFDDESGLGRFFENGQPDWSFAWNEYNYGSDDMRIVALSTGDFMVGNAYEVAEDMGLARHDQNGVKNNTFKPLLALDGYYSGIVKSGSSYYVTGWFNRLNNEPAQNIARLRGNYSVDKNFKTQQNFSYTWAPQAFADGKVVFQSEWYGFVKLNQDGTWDENFNLDYSWPILWGWDELFVVGNKMVFTSDWGVTRRNADGSLDNTFTTQYFYNYEDRYWLDADIGADGKIVIGGYFTSIAPANSGEPTYVPHITRLNEDGTLDNTFNVGYGPNYQYVNGICITANNEIMVKGYFNYWDDHYLGDASQGLVKLSETGELDLNFVENYMSHPYYSSYNYQAPIAFRDGIIYGTNYGYKFLGWDGENHDYLPENVYAYNTDAFYTPDHRTLYIAGWFYNYDNGTETSMIKINYPAVPIPSAPEEEEVLNNARMAVYPNPSTDYIAIEAPAKVKVAIMSMDGTIKLSKEVTSADQKIDVRGLTPGRYVIKMIIDGKVLTQHLVKE